MSKIIIVSGPVIVKDSKVLLDIQGDDAFWKFCGGRVQEDEVLQETAARRAKEELGIDINIIDLKPFLFHISKDSDGETHDIILAHFLSSFSGNIRIGNGVKEYRWFSREELPSNLAPNIVPVLKHFGFIE
jgi:ADP-ribose pyrophosphatase YjhB (NUDIX family)